MPLHPIFQGIMDAHLAPAKSSTTRFLSVKKRQVLIETSYDPKPIPTTRFDWSAITVDYEPGDPVGHGATEAEAIADLKEQMEDE